MVKISSMFYNTLTNKYFNFFEKQSLFRPGVDQRLVLFIKQKTTGYASGRKENDKDFSGGYRYVNNFFL